MAETGPRGEPPLRRWTVVFRGGALGDFILTLPVLAALRDSGVAVHLVADPRHVEIAVAGGLAARGSRLDDPRWAALWAGGRLASVRDALVDVGRAVVLRPVDGPAVAARLRRCGVEQVVVHDPRPPSDGSVHAADHLLAALGPGAAPARPVLMLARGEGARGRRGGRRLIVAPGAGAQRKRWPREHVLALTAGWRRGGGEVAVLIGPVERERGERWSDAGVEVLVDDGPLEAAVLLAGADVVVGNDTGTSHLAAAVGTALVVLFGPSDDRVWAPRGDRVRVLCAPDRSLAALRPSAVLAAAREVAAIPPGGENAISTPAPVSLRTD